MDVEEEALFAYSYSCPAYYVQSPSTESHANSTDCHNQDLSLSLSAYHSPPPPPISQNFTKTTAQFDTSRLSLSRCGSNRSFIVHHKKISYDDIQSQDTGVEITDGKDHGHEVSMRDHHHHDKGCDEEEEDEEGVYYYGSDNGGWWKYFSFGTFPSSCVWISIQLCWRFIVSLAAALLVFYIATKPPPPHISVKVTSIQEFELGEGVDASGVATNILTFNCSMEVIIDNKSKVFGLHMLSPTMETSFGNFVFARSHGPRVFAPSHRSTLFKFYVAAAKKAMYGAGRSMEDMLESGKALPLVVRVAFTSNFHVIGSLIKPTFHHRAGCSLFLQNVYDTKHRTQAFNSTCNVFSN
ncbi:hypothetical protein Ancab_006609 [Ancistrocladus abbreviatus]